MTDEELRVRAIQELEFYKKDDTFMLADITVDLAIKAIKALEQMPVTTTAGEGGVIYYPQVEGVTPTVIDAGKQEPCEDAISRQSVLNALYALCDAGETLKENPWRDNPHIDAVVETIEELLPVTPQPKTGHWIKMLLTDMSDIAGQCSECGFIHKFIGGHTAQYNYCPNCGCRMVEPQERSGEE